MSDPEHFPLPQVCAMLQPTTPSIFPGLFPSQEPADSRNSSEGQQPLPARAAPLTPEGELLFGFSLISSWHSHGDGFPSSRKRAIAVHWNPSGVWGGPAGCWAQGGGGQNQPCTAPSLIGTKNAKGQGLLLAPIPFHGPAVTRPEWEPQ